MGKKQLKPPEPPFTIQEYEKSSWWKHKTSVILNDRNVTCFVCGRKRWKWLPRAKKWKRMLSFSTHHVRYTNIPYEKEGDIIPMCVCCHRLFHDLLRLETLGGPYIELAKIAKKYFPYEKETYIKKEKGEVK